MCSTSLTHPDQIFSRVVPSPPPWPKPTPLLPQTASSLRWKALDDDNKTLTIVLLRLQRTLRYVHKRKIFWPVEETISSEYVFPPNY